VRDSFCKYSRALSAALLLFLACAKAQDKIVPVAVHVRICDVIGAPSRFEGKLITFRGRFSSDCHHGSTLSDFACRYRGMAAYTDSTMAPAKREALEDAVCPPGPRNRYSDATAIFTGTVRRVDRSNQLLLNRWDFELAITDVEDMRVVKPSGPSD
jgi:hypothetical protein